MGKAQDPPENPEQMPDPDAQTSNLIPGLSANDSLEDDPIVAKLILGLAAKDDPKSRREAFDRLYPPTQKPAA
jgi:hypothetical protein